MLNQNPVFQKEIKLGARTIRLTMLILIFNAILALVSFFVLSGMIKTVKYEGVMEYESLISIYSTMAYLEFSMFMFLIPASTAGSISGERERKTFDILLTGNLSPMGILIGKLEASIHIVELLAISSLPILSLVFIFGGINAFDLIIMFFTLLVSGVFVGSIGLFYSTICKKTTNATALSYLTVFFLIFGTYGGIYLVHYLIADSPHGVGRMIYLFLMNPAVTYSTMLSAQVEDVDIIRTLYEKFASDMINGRVIKHWLFYSLILQLGSSAGLLWVSAWIIDPLKKSFSAFFMDKNQNKTIHDYKTDIHISEKEKEMRNNEPD